MNFYLKLLLTVLALTSVVSCSDSDQDIKTVRKMDFEEFMIEADGRWVFNESQCDGELQPVGVYDVAFDETGISLGQHHVDGEWRPIDNPGPFLESIRDFARACGAIKEERIAIAFFTVKTPSATRIVALGNDHLFMLKSSEGIQYLVPFSNDVFDGMPISDKQPTNYSVEYEHIMKIDKPNFIIQ